MIEQLKGRKQEGFTVVELLVSVGIIMLIVGVLVFNYQSFRGKSSLARLVRDLALVVREAQVFGLAVREFPSTSGGPGEFPPYGIHIKTDEGISREVILFADLADGAGGTDREGIYDPGDDCGGVDTECLRRTSLIGPETIDDICVSLSGQIDDYDCDITELNISFRRPDPDALILSTGGTEYSAALITLGFTNRDLERETRSVRVWVTGQISVE